MTDDIHKIAEQRLAERNATQEELDAALVEVNRLKGEWDAAVRDMRKAMDERDRKALDASAYLSQRDAARAEVERLRGLLNGQLELLDAARLVVLAEDLREKLARPPTAPALEAQADRDAAGEGCTCVESPKSWPAQAAHFRECPRYTAPGGVALPKAAERLRANLEALRDCIDFNAKTDHIVDSANRLVDECLALLPATQDQIKEAAALERETWARHWHKLQLQMEENEGFGTEFAACIRLALRSFGA